MGNIRLSIIFVSLLVILLNTSIVYSSSILPAALEEGYHAPLYTRNIEHISTNGEFIIMPSVDVSETVELRDLVAENQVGIGTTNPLSTFHVRLTRVDDSMLISRPTPQEGNVLVMGNNDHSMRFRYDSSPAVFVIETTGSDNHINLNPSGNLGIGIGDNNPARHLDVGGDVILRDELLMITMLNEGNKIVNLADPVDSKDAVTKQYLENQIISASSKWESAEKETIYYGEGNVLIKGKLGVGNIPEQRLTVVGNLRVDGSYFVGGSEGQTGEVSLFDEDDYDCELTISGGIVTGIACEEECVPYTCEDIRATHEYGSDACGRFFDGCEYFIDCGCSAGRVCGVHEDDMAELQLGSGTQTAQCVPNEGCNPVIEVPEIEPNQYGRVYCSRQAGSETFEEACQGVGSASLPVYHRDNTCYAAGELCEHHFEIDELYPIVNSNDHFLDAIRPGHSTGFFNCESSPSEPPPSGPDDPIDEEP